MSLEITMKIFIDDLEMAIQKSGNEGFAISEHSDKKTIESEIEKYLENRLVIETDAKKTLKKMIGYEIDNDALICYVEIEDVAYFKQIKIRNSILTEVFADQINLTHLQYKDQLKSIKTTRSVPEGTIDTSAW